MYLSVLELDPRYMSAAKSLADLDCMHKNIQGSFDASRSEHNVLYRVFDYPERKLVYVQSDIAPDWSRVDGRGIKLLEARDINGLTNAFQEGRTLRFDLKAYPCRRREGRKYTIRDSFGKIEWLKRMAEQNGFSVEDVSILNVESYSINKKTGVYSLPVTTFNGLLKITDVKRFKESFRMGIGPEKAFGCGMLMVKPAA